MVQRLEIIEGRLENISSHNDIFTYNNNDAQSSFMIDKDCNIPLDKIIDLEIFENNISSSKDFRTKLVIIYINNNCWVSWYYILIYYIMFFIK